MKKNDLYELEIESIGFEGISIARHEGAVVFVKDGIPGDKVSAKITKKKNNYYEARLENLLTPSKHRVEAICEHFNYCGGCTWQNFDYSEQLRWKAIHVVDSFQRLGGLTDIVVLPTKHSENQFHYRNKMDFSFSSSRWLTPDEIKDVDNVADKDFSLGLHVKGNFLKVLDITRCYIQTEKANEILAVVKKYAKQNIISAYNTLNSTGYLRSLIIRYSKLENKYLIVLITNKIIEESEKQSIVAIEELFEGLKINHTFIHCINSTKSPVAIESSEIIFGNGKLTEEILGIKYEVSPFSFFQTNFTALDVFIGEILNFADIKKDENLWDLYCGTGSITLPASRLCNSITGIELVESSINDAKQNAISNQITNAEFICANLHDKESPEILKSLTRPDTIIIDPPRAGMHENLVKHILDVEAKKIVYVSCNPATQARDCKLLSEKYNIIKVQPFDMFPNTYHIESIALLTLKSS